MKGSFVPLSEVPAQTAKQYLGALGYSPEIVEWKYFDASFNRGRERGYAWLHDGRMQGFIGLIPFRAARGTESVHTAWLCDWSVERQEATGGVGVMLLWQAFRSFPILFGLGGNQRSRVLFPKMAAKTVEGAASALYLPLRLGAGLRALPAGLRSKLPRALGRIPLRRIAPHPKESLVVVEKGVSQSLRPLLDRANAGAAWIPRYDVDYLDWQIGRCPDLTCHSAFIPSDGGPHAAVLFWHARTDATYWRMATIDDGQAGHQIPPLLAAAARHVSANGGQMFACLASHLDKSRVGSLRSAGFLPARGKRALYVMVGRSKPLVVEELAGLTYLDTDLAHFL